MSKQKDDKGDLSGPHKAAAFLLALDSDVASLILQNLNEREVALVTEQMAKLGEVSGREVQQAFTAFSQRAGDSIAAEPAINAMLERALGKDKAKEFLSKMRRQNVGAAPFQSLGALSAAQILSLLKGENPQVQALVVSHLSPQVSSEILKNLDEDARYEVVKRMAASEDLPVDLINQVDEMFESRAAGMGGKGGGASGGSKDENVRFKTVAQMLNVTDPAMSKSLIERLARDAPNAANEIQAMMFVFEDVLKISDRDMQKVMTEIDKADLALALKAGAPELVDKFLKNLSERARDNIKDEIEMLGPKPLSEVEEAQKRIIQQIRQMEEHGDITVNRGGGEVMV